MVEIRMLRSSSFLVSLVSLCLLADVHSQSAEQILSETGITGGLVVVAGGLEEELLTGFAEAGPFLVHGLTDDSSKLAGLRDQLTKRGLAGPVSVDRMGGRLPYIDNSVNLLVVRGGDMPFSPAEADRVLAPRGVACVNGKRTVKPVPETIDEWTHYLYGPDNNAVSSDMEVAPPRRMQWVAGPKYGRHHDKMSSVSAVVSAGGRIFTIIDEGPLWSILTPPKWSLTARDAFNGKLLWRREIPTWHSHLFGLKSGPATLPRRLVAKDGKVYATLGLAAPLSQLDAAAGKTLREYKGTEGATEILLASGILYVVCGSHSGSGPWFAEGERTLMAVRAGSGEVLWREPRRVVPGTLTVLDECVYFFENDKVACLDSATGKTRWHSEAVPRPSRYPSQYVPLLVATPKVILIAGGEGGIGGGWSTKGARDTLTALDASSGKPMWTAHHPDSGYRSAEDVFVIDNMVWFGDTRDGAKPGRTYGLDLMTGEEKVKFPPDRDIYFFHHRCHRAKATERWLLTSRAGIEFIDFRNEHWEMNHWVRGACLYGIVPCNGLVYAPQHPCACYLEAKMDGFNALAPAKKTARLPATLPERFEMGPAFGTKAGAIAGDEADWPTYRHDNERSGSTEVALSGKFGEAYSIDLGGKLTAPVAGGGLLFTAQADAHRVLAFEAGNGEQRWSFTAGGRVDSPPTIHGNLILFGCRDGHIYCLRAEDGALVWRFRAAPLDERMVACEQLESVWPVHGSVLVREGVVFAAAGRSMFLDEGVRLVRLDPETGKLLGETLMDGHEKADGKDHQDYVAWLNMPVGKPDILSCKGGCVYMRSQPFSPGGKRLPLKAKPWNGRADQGAPPPDQDPARAHVFSPTGFLDDTGWHRTYWIYGSDFYSGWAGYPTAGRVTPAGKIMVFDDENVYGFGRRRQYWRWTTPLEFHLFAASTGKAGQLKLGVRRKKGEQAQQEQANLPSGYIWSQTYPILARAMCKAGDTIYVAGVRDVMDETKKKQGDGAAQVEHWEGKHGGILLAVSAKDGARKSSLDLVSPPVFDSLIAARGSLYFTTIDGKLVRLAPQG